MHFKHPELLYALFLLVIPVIVHLFQLRKFRKEKFTNVKFLRKATLQTRKSARIKKWLVLSTRLLLLAAIVLAFAQPYIPSESVTATNAGETVIYLDNSYSMQARGSSGILLKRGIQELLENLPQEELVSLFTNNEEFRDVTKEALRQDLQQLSYSPTQLDWKALALKAGNMFSEGENISRNFIAISDFQTTEMASEKPGEIPGLHSSFVQLRPESRLNARIDTAFVSTQTLDETVISLRVSGADLSSPEVPVSIYDNHILLAKKTVVLDENLSASTTFDLPSGEFRNGRIAIDAPGLPFDDELFFSINGTVQIEVVVLNNSDDSFLHRIFTAPDFRLRSFPEEQVDFIVLSEANLVILNEPEAISGALSARLQDLLQQGVYFVMIPSEDGDRENYNRFFRNAGLPLFEEKQVQEKLITDISFSHPLYESVFDDQVQNFQYPNVRSSYPINRPITSALSFNDGQPFLFQSGNSFVFTAPLNTSNSNFRQSPLIVPSFYNIGNLSLKSSQLYYMLGRSAKMDVNASLGNDEILKVTSEDFSFIPRQQSFQNKVELVFEESPEEAGHYSILNDTTRLANISFNINREESLLDYWNFESSEGLRVSNSVAGVFQEIYSENDTDVLWKWFVIFALILLLMEMLILKYFK